MKHTRKSKKIASAIVLASLLVAVATVILHHFYVVNITDSFPRGLYKKVKPSYEKGELVLFCPPINEATALAYERHYLKGGICENGYSYMIKKIAGAPGDIVSIGKNGVLVNGKKIPQTEQHEIDGQGRPMPTLTIENYQLAEREYIVVSDYNEYSYDSRYMGCIDQQSIVAGLLPLWIKF